MCSIGVVDFENCHLISFERANLHQAIQSVLDAQKQLDFHVHNQSHTIEQGPFYALDLVNTHAFNPAALLRFALAAKDFQSRPDSHIVSMQEGYFPIHISYNSLEEFFQRFSIHPGKNSISPELFEMTRKLVQSVAPATSSIEKFSSNTSKTRRFE